MRSVRGGIFRFLASFGREGVEVEVGYLCGADGRGGQVLAVDSCGGVGLGYGRMLAPRR